MFIVIQSQGGKRLGDPMLLDSVSGHRKTFEAVKAFLASSATALEIEGAEPGHLCPDSPTLRAFRMVKSEGLIRTEQLPEGVLCVSGRPDLLARYAAQFLFGPDQDGAHRHPEDVLAVAGGLDPKSDSVIIEVENDLDGGQG